MVSELLWPAARERRTAVDRHVAVETTGELTYGQTVIDHDARFAEPNADVVFGASRERFLALLHAALRS